MTHHTTQTTLFPTPDGAPSREGLAERWALWSIEGIGSTRLQRLVKLCQGELGRLWRSPQEAARLTAKLGLSKRIAASLAAMLDVPAEDHYARELELLAHDEVLWHRHDSRYPRALLDLHDPPEFVYIKGAQSCWPTPESPLALVGSRQIPATHERAARTLAEQLARQGITIISGGALGMDGAAHRGALDAEGVTCAVLPGGLRKMSPRRHQVLFSEMAERGGAMLSEYPLDCVARRYHYARRNRLIASLSRGVLVLKAARQGGTLLTVGAAEELGRVVMALPYEASDEAARGSHALIRSGRAVMVCEVEDVLAHGFGRLIHHPEPGVNQGGVTSFEPAVPRSQEVVPWHETQQICGVDELACLWRVSVAEAMVRLFELEICGAVRKVPGAARYERLARVKSEYHSVFEPETPALKG